jgi:hypothetical protein
MDGTGVTGNKAGTGGSGHGAGKEGTLPRAQGEIGENLCQR